MTTAVHGRERSVSARKPFGWIQRLYKKSPSQEVELDRENRMFSPDGSVNESPFLANGAHDHNPGAANDLSSLRPTISTRAPSFAQSTASNVAFLNVELMQPHPDVDHERTPRLVEDEGDVADMSMASRTDNDTRVSDSEESEVGPLMSASEAEARSTRPMDKLYTASMSSSKDSPIPSIFTTKTTETGPTMSNFTHSASILSSRNTGFQGAQDNASMLTLASSSKGPNRRRTSTDTNCSVRALAPASARASFESGRTGLTDVRKIHSSNPSSLMVVEDSSSAHAASFARLRAPATAESIQNRKSLGGLSTLSLQSASVYEQ